jgi:hypothetical protein
MERGQYLPEGHGRIVGASAKGGDRTKKPFQFLNEIGTIALGRHLGRVQEIAEDSADKWEYEARIAKRFGFEQQLELPIPYRNPLRKRPPTEAALLPFFMQSGFLCLVVS